MEKGKSIPQSCGDRRLQGEPITKIKYCSGDPEGAIGCSLCRVPVSKERRVVFIKEFGQDEWKRVRIFEL
jgi:hypothetical protein